MEKKTKKRVRFSNAGREVVEVEMTPEQVAAEEQAKVEAAKMTRAQQRLMRLVAGESDADEPDIETLPLGGEDWYLKRLDFAELTFVYYDVDNLKVFGTKCPRLRRLTAALLYHGLAASADDPDTRYFADLEEARKFTITRKGVIKQQVNVIFHRLGEMNPDAIEVVLKNA